MCIPLYSPLLTLFPSHHLSNPIPFQPSTSPDTHRNSKLSMEIITITPIARQPSIYFLSTNLSPSFSLPKALFSSTSSSIPYRKNLIAKRGPTIAMALQSSSASPALGQYLPFCHSLHWYIGILQHSCETRFLCNQIYLEIVFKHLNLRLLGKLCAFFPNWGHLGQLSMVNGQVIQILTRCGQKFSTVGWCWLIWWRRTEENVESNGSYAIVLCIWSMNCEV